MRPVPSLHKPSLWAHPIQHFYEKVIKVKADVAALLGLISFFWRLARQFHRSSVSWFFTFLVLGGFRHISTENLALGSLRSDDWQLGRLAVPPFCLSCRETLLIFFRAA